MYSMNDPRWSNIKLGNTRHKIGRHGSALVVLAEFLRSTGEDTDPARLNRELCLYSGFDKRGWPVPSALVGFGLTVHEQILDRLDDDYLKRIRGWIRQQYLVLLVVNRGTGRRYQPHALGALSLHWGDILVHDPILPEDLQVPVQLLPRYGFPHQHLPDVIRAAWAFDLAARRYE